MRDEKKRIIEDFERIVKGIAELVTDAADADTDEGQDVMKNLDNSLVRVPKENAHQTVETEILRVF